MKKLLKLVYNDFVGIVDLVFEDYRYCVVFIDDFLGIVFVYFLNMKSDIVVVIERFLVYLLFGKVG